jgi:quercetin dioxygenase-like cupin family protein
MLFANLRLVAQSSCNGIAGALILLTLAACHPQVVTHQPAPSGVPDLVTADPKHAKLEFENERLRVVRLRLPPHEKTPMHSHPDRVVVYMTDVHVRITFPDGTSGDADVKGGTTSWSEAVIHAGENTSDQPWEIVEVELKGSKWTRR